ncbi:MAG: hypothetical protein KGL12_08045 [Rhodospirillales bacterium]|nr:hypothetical protein [Rhodospirillales bacterium]
MFASATSAPAYAYDPYGNPLQGTAPATDFGYAGLFYNADSGLDLAGARAYDPVAGRWLSRDPLGEGADPQGNLYAYVGGDPVGAVDPSGRFGLLVGALVGAGVGGGVDLAAQLAGNGGNLSCVSWGEVGASALTGALVGSGEAVVALAVEEAAEGAGGLGLEAAESWGNPATLARHFADHGADFGATSAEDYASQASQFLERSQAEGLPTKIDPSGTIRTYDPASNTFGAYNANGTTRTFFQPTSPTYFARQPGVPPAIFGGP